MGAVLPNLLGSVYYSCAESLDEKKKLLLIYLCVYSCLHFSYPQNLKKKWPEIDIPLEEIHWNTVKSLQNFAGKL